METLPSGVLAQTGKWFKRRLPTRVHLTGWDFKIEFGPGGKITFVGWSAVHRMVKVLEFKLYGYSEARWRHIFDPRFARHLMTVCARNIDYAFMKSMMPSDELGYKLEFVKKLMKPLEVLQSWALYVFDAESKNMLVMDPTTTFYGEDVMRAKHESSAKRALHGPSVLHQREPT